MRMIIRKQEAEGWKFVDRLSIPKRIVQVIVCQDAAGAEPPPVAPAGGIGKNRRLRIMDIPAFSEVCPLLSTPEVQVGFRGGSGLKGNLDQRRLEIADERHKEHPQQSDGDGFRARRLDMSELRRFLECAGTHKIVGDAKGANARQGKLRRSRQVEADRAADIADNRQHCGHQVTHVVIADRVARHPGIVRREGHAALRGAQEGQFHGLFRIQNRVLMRSIDRPNEKQDQKQ